MKYFSTVVIFDENSRINWIFTEPTAAIGTICTISYDYHLFVYNTGKKYFKNISALSSNFNFIETYRAKRNEIIRNIITRKMEEKWMR